MKKRILFVFLFLICTKVISQNKQLVYGFAEAPQTLMINPGAETNFKYHIGIPGLSGTSINIGSTGIDISDLFLKGGLSFTDKVETVMNNLTERDFLSLNVQIDILNGGHRLDEKTYLSFGFYEELDFIGYFPKDVAQLLFYGNSAYLNRSFQLSQMRMRGEILGVLHAGISRKINSKLNLGGRFKIYSGSAHIKTTNNSGSFTTVENENNIYRNYLNNVNVEIQTSGLYEGDFFNVGSKGLISNSFLSKNMGVGLDLGFTYHYTPQLEFTGSLLDVGFVSYSKNVKNLTIKGDYTFDGVEFLYDSANPPDYWAQLDSDFKAKVPREQNSEAYISWRPVKFNAGVKYSFGRARLNKECYDVTYKNYYNNAIGVQLYTVVRPLGNQLATTAFVEKSIGERFHVKFTYTADDYSFSNLGFGISTQMGIFHMYGMVDNLLKLSDIAEANTASLQFGFNLIFD